MGRDGREGGGRKVERAEREAERQEGREEGGERKREGRKGRESLPSIVLSEEFSLLFLLVGGTSIASSSVSSLPVAGREQAIALTVCKSSIGKGRCSQGTMQFDN